VGGFTISLSAVIVGIESALCCTSFYMLIMKLFQMPRQRINGNTPSLRQVFLTPTPMVQAANYLCLAKMLIETQCSQTTAPRY
jgi:hypothetical protein